ncbi:hypothetical protein [Natronococcus roseus]|uniref:hypothetical protein n=1 Tax=Natronococcus roseus TaxID=1052014 RepID=UPI00374DF0C3
MLESITGKGDAPFRSYHENVADAALIDAEEGDALEIEIAEEPTNGADTHEFDAVVGETFGHGTSCVGNELVELDVDGLKHPLLAWVKTGDLAVPSGATPMHLVEAEPVDGHDTLLETLETIFGEEAAGYAPETSDATYEARVDDVYGGVERTEAREAGFEIVDVVEHEDGGALLELDHPAEGDA